jgi:tetratricopeptide (TPR) repeat protein
VLSRIGSSDKILLGNAARFSGKWALAQEAYLSARSSSDLGARSLSAYYLARVALDGQGNTTEATRWFYTYLREAPNGELSASARARLMDLLEKAGDRSRARKVAEEYVKVHPNGPHLDRARRLSESGP